MSSADPLVQLSAHRGVNIASIPDLTRGLARVKIVCTYSINTQSERRDELWHTRI